MHTSIRNCNLPGSASVDLRQVSGGKSNDYHEALAGPASFSPRGNPQPTDRSLATDLIVHGSVCLQLVQLGGGGEGAVESVWYCPDCKDGPIPNWNPVCVNCDSKRAGGCWMERTTPREHDSFGAPEDGPPDTETGWYCDNCGDGPMQDWNPVCSDCGQKR
jgi:hypothetical protein